MSFGLPKNRCEKWVGFLSREKASLFTSIDAWSGDGGHRNGISPKFDAPAGRCSKAAKVTQESDRGPAAGGPERAGRLIPFGNIPFSPSHVCSVSHLRPKAGGEWMSFRFCRSGAVEKVRHKRRKCANAPASRTDMRVDGPCARWGDRARLVRRVRAGAVALVGKGDRVMSWLRRRMVSG